MVPVKTGVFRGSVRAVRASPGVAVLSDSPSVKILLVAPVTAPLPPLLFCILTAMLMFSRIPVIDLLSNAENTESSAHALQRSQNTKEVTAYIPLSSPIETFEQAPTTLCR